METQKSPFFIILVILGVVAIVVGYSMFGSSKLSPANGTPTPVVTATQSPVACTQEAKICPDGSSVGRVGPNCEFAQCPTAPGANTFNLRIGETKTKSGVSIQPLEVTQDSRCPAKATCIWAGTVEVRTKITDATGPSEVTFSPNMPIQDGGLTITLTKVLPQKTQTAIKSADYIFTFTVTEK